MRNKKFLILFSIFYFLFSASSALAFESTSTTFEMHGAAIESVSGSSSSPSFGEQSAGGQNGTGIVSLVKQISSGVLYWLFGWYVPRYDQVHYRWRNDDVGCSESSTTCWVTGVGEDAAYTSFPKTTNKRIRFEISNEGWSRGAAPQFKLQYKQSLPCESGSYTDVPVTPTTEHWQIATSSNFADEDLTSNVSPGLTDTNNTFALGRIKDTGNTTSGITLNSDNFTEIEYSIQATTNAVSGQTYCFRVLDSNLAPTKMIYTPAKYAKATIAGYPAAGSVISATYDTGLAEGAAYNSLLWKGTLNSGKVKFQLGTSNCANGDTNPPTCNNGVGWQYYDSLCVAGGSTWYDAAPDTSVEIGCPSIHNNKRYFRYQIQLCSASDCVSSGSGSPQVDDVSVNWSP